MQKVSHQANKGCVRVIFKPGDWVWVHLRKERFLSLRKSKLHPRGDDPFQALERINDNAYKIDLLSNYVITAIFNVSNLSPFDFDEVDDSRTNLHEERGNDANQTNTNHVDKYDDLLKYDGPMTRTHMKKFKNALGVFVKQEVKLELMNQSTSANVAQLSEFGESLIQGKNHHF